MQDGAHFVVLLLFRGITYDKQPTECLGKKNHTHAWGFSHIKRSEVSFSVRNILFILFVATYVRELFA